MTSVLVIDDRATDRELARTLLEHSGFDVLEAASAEDGLRVVAAQAPDIVVSDVSMPSMNGYELVRRLSERGDAPPVVLCSASFDRPEMGGLMTAFGTVQVLTKPYSPQQLLAAIRHGLESGSGPPVAPDADFDRRLAETLNDKLVAKLRELEATQNERRRLLALLISAQEAERERLAHGLHDTVLQELAAMKLQLARLAMRTEDADERTALETIASGAGRCVRMTRDLLVDLITPDLGSNGLATLLRRHFDDIRSGSPELALEFTPRLRTEPTPDAGLLLYRAVQEVVANARKHANADRITVLLDEDGGQYRVMVHDDGDGFDVGAGMVPRRGHLGLPALRERIEAAGGELTVTSAPGSSTSVDIVIPVALDA